MMDKQYIDLDGTFNFRDIGGYVTRDGSRVKYGKLYRSDELSKLTTRDISVIKRLKIRTIIDYRNKQERVNNENVQIEGTTTYYLDPIADIAAFAASEKNDQANGFDLSKLNAKLAKHLMIEQNKAFVTDQRCQKAFSCMFDLILDKRNSAVLQHCRGGKDRTGYGVALILLVLGVSRADVIHDYLLTNTYKLEKNEKSLAEIFEKTQNEDLVQSIRYFKEANVQFLTTALDLIDNQYGGILNYVKTELGLSEDQIHQLKDLYLE